MRLCWNGIGGEEGGSTRMIDSEGGRIICMYVCMYVCVFVCE